MGLAPPLFTAACLSPALKCDFQSTIGRGLNSYFKTQGVLCMFLGCVTSHCVALRCVTCNRHRESQGRICFLLNQLFVLYSVTFSGDGRSPDSSILLRCLLVAPSKKDLKHKHHVLKSYEGCLHENRIALLCVNNDTAFMLETFGSLYCRVSAVSTRFLRCSVYT